MRYDYECESCGVFEVQQSMSEDALETCPDCGGHVQRLISGGVAIHFKGSGFYSTDYSGSNGTSNGTGDGTSNGTSDGAAAAPADSKTSDAVSGGG